MSRHYITNGFAFLKLNHCTRCHGCWRNALEEATSRLVFLTEQQTAIFLSSPSSRCVTKCKYLNSQSQSVDQKAKWTRLCRTRLTMQVSARLFAPAITSTLTEPDVPNTTFFNNLNFMRHRSQQQLKKHKHPYQCTSPQDSAAFVHWDLQLLLLVSSVVLHRPETIFMKISYLLNSYNSWPFPLHILSESG